jgi:hypothetical protein
MVVAAQPASIAWAARDAAAEQVAIGQKAPVTLTAKDATVEAAVAGLRASVAMAARDAVGEGWSPALLPLTGWWRDYDGGKASAGTSGSNHLESVRDDDPDVGTLNGHGVAVFDVSEDLRLETPFSQLVGLESATFSGWTVLRVEDPGGHAFAVSSDLYLTWNAINGLVFSHNSIFVRKALALDTWVVATFRCTGSQIQIGINEIPGASGGETVAADANAISGEDQTFAVGQLDSSNRFTGRIAEVGVTSQLLSDQHYTDILAYTAREFGVPSGS